MNTSEKLVNLAREIDRKSHALNDQMVNFLADLVRIQSYTGEEGPAVERTLQELRAIGCDKVWMDSAGNAMGQIGSGKNVILFNGHLDTNEIADENEWPHPPLEPVVENGIMYGLGTSDCKGGVAPIVYAGAIIKELGLSDDFTLLIMGATLEEDAEGFALRSLIEKDGVKPDVVLICEASDMTLRVGQRGRCEIRVRTTGKATHASHPHHGENAILKMIPIMQAIEKMKETFPSHPVFGKDDQVITLISGPHTPNTVPSWCEIAIDRRLMSGETMESILREIKAVVEPLGGHAWIPDQPVLTHTGQRLDGPSFYPGFLLPDNSALLAASQATHQALWDKPAEVDIWKFSTDATYSAGVAGIPSIGFGPQEAEYCHTPEDQIDLEKMRKAAAFYALFPFLYCDVLKR